MNEQEIYIEAMERQDLAERQRFLDDACAGDQSRRDRVENLMRQSDQLGSFLEHPPVEAVVAEAGIGSDPCGDLNPTIQYLNGSTVDREPIAPERKMRRNAKEHDEEILLGYLQPSTQPDSLGRLGHYEVLEVIGRGAFGTVLRAFDEKLHRVVAIKVMSPEMAATSPARKRFLREAHASAAIRHEHVVSIYAVEEKPLPYLVMEFIPGQTLQQRLDEQGPLDVPTVLRIGRQIAEGLVAAHAQDLIHRDIKPANILLETGAREMVKVTDFGLARAADDASLTQSGTIAGTPMYMAPEQAQGLKLDQRADLFSFGSVMYQMVSGRPPFRATTTLAVLKRLAEDTPRPIREIIPETPQWLCDIITKLHAKNPEERYQSAREIANVLAHCETQFKAHSELKDFTLIPKVAEEATIQPQTQNEIRQVRRRRIVTAMALAGVVLLGAILLSLKTMNGEVIVEIPDDLPTEVKKQIKIEVSGNGDVRVANEANGWTIGVKAGKYDIQLSGGRDHVEINDKQVTVTRRKQTIVRVTMKAAETQAAKSTNATTSPTNSNQTPNVSAYNWPKDAPRPAMAPFDAAQARAHQEVWAKHLGVPVEYTNSIGMKFVLIPPGEFTMGSTAAEIKAALKVAYPTATHWHDCIRSEAPQHKVILTQPIYLGIHEVTQAEYEKVTGTNPSHFAPNGPGEEAVAGMNTSNHPIETVSWNDAVEFCTHLSQLEKLKPAPLREDAANMPPEITGYRLPSEAEWEFACRAGTTTKFWIGDNDEDLEQAGWFGENSGDRTHAAGELKANPFGLFDIHGNVWEWVQDGWEPGFYRDFTKTPAINPISPSAPETERIIRGGRWYHDASYCRSSFRLSVAPTDRFEDLGFRVSLSIDAVKATIANRTPMANPDPLPPMSTNSIGMEFVIVPKGKSFAAGSSRDFGTMKNSDF